VVKVLTAEEETILQAAYNDIPSGNSANEVAWLLALAKVGSVEQREFRIGEALRHARAVSGWPRVGLISDIIPYCDRKSQVTLKAELVSEIEVLDTGDQWYALPKATQLLDIEFQRHMCREIVRGTPDDKLYALDVLCTVLDKASAFELLERAESTEADQLLPHLVIALARLGCFAQAFEVQSRISEGGRVDALLGMVKYLNVSDIGTTIERAKTIQGNDYFQQQRDQVFAAIVERSRRHAAGKGPEGRDYRRVPGSREGYRIT